MSRKKQAEKIKNDVIQWSKQVLEPMNKHLGFPACPSNPATVEGEEFLVDPTDNCEYESDLSYSMMLIQKFKQLYEASCKLHKIGYYEKWPAEYYDEVVKTRQDTYEKLFKKEKTS